MTSKTSPKSNNHFQYISNSEQSTNLIDYYAALEAHDWTYTYSSDHKSYLRGQNESIRLSEIANSCPLASALYIAYSAYLFSGREKPPVPASPEVESNPRRQQFVLKLNRCLEKLFSDSTISVDVIASNLAMSERQLYRLTKRILEVTPREYLRCFRLEKARKILDKGESACFATFETGFSSQSYFGKCFKAQFGVSPSDYKGSRYRLH